MMAPLDTFSMSSQLSNPSRPRTRTRSATRTLRARCTYVGKLPGLYGRQTSMPGSPISRTTTNQSSQVSWSVPPVCPPIEHAERLTRWPSSSCLLQHGMSSTSEWHTHKRRSDKQEGDNSKAIASSANEGRTGTNI